ncbi:MAG: IS200/IS605 family transposase [Solirubrobacteraceae bacterium]
MTLWRLFYHVVFVTEDRRPLLKEAFRLRLTGALRAKAEELGCYVHAIYVRPEHVHVAVSIPPVQSIAAVVGQMKGATSHLIEREMTPGEPFAWRRGYGVFSFGERNLPDVVRYINDQDARHANNQLWQPLENIEESELLAASKSDFASPEVVC